MALTYGFFNSINGDRVYSADDMTEMFDGLITDGVFQNVGDAMRVVATSELNVNVSTGRARINSQWAKIDAPYSITLNNAHVTLNRYTAICLRVDFANRQITLIARDGSNATAPTKPAPIRNEYFYEIILAYVYVKAGASNINDSNIEDTRANTSLCGIVSSLVQQLDTSELYNQYNAAYTEQLKIMENWFKEQKALYDQWFNDLTENLNVDTSIVWDTAVVTDYDNRTVNIPSSLNYNDGDVLLVHLEGVFLTPGVDYSIDVLTIEKPFGGTEEIQLISLVNSVSSGKKFTFTVIKSKIGLNS